MLSGWSDCELQAAARQWPEMFLERGFNLNQTRPSIGMLVGTGAHATVGYSAQYKSRTGTLPTFNEAVEFGAEQFLREFEKVATDGRYDGWDTITPDYNRAQQQIITIAKTYKEQVGYREMPSIVEKELFVSLDKIAKGWKLSGRVDNYLEDGHHWDFKTGRKGSNHLLQVSAYDLVLTSHSLPTKGGGVVRIPRPTKHQTPEASWEPYDVAIGRKIVWQRLREITQKVEAFQSGGPTYLFVANPNSMWCRSTSCPLFGTEACSMWKYK